MTYPRRHTRRTWIALCGLLPAVALAGLAVGALGWRRPPATIGMDTPLGATEVQVGIDQLIGDYLGDERAADQKYRFKTVAVTGVALELDRRDPQVATLVIVKQLGGKESPCACRGGRALERAASGLSPGQPVTVRGKLAGQERMKVVLLGCEIVVKPKGALQ